MNSPVNKSLLFKQWKMRQKFSFFIQYLDMKVIAKVALISLDANQCADSNKYLIDLSKRKSEHLEKIAIM